MDVDKSKILSSLSPLVVRDTFSVTDTFTQLSEEFSEESLIQTFIEATTKQKQAFFNACFKPDFSLHNQAFPIETNMFTDETQSIISMMSQFLGLDIDRYVTKSLMSLLFIISTDQVKSVESSHSCCIKFDDLLAKSIHSQLMNFHNTRFFRFQSYLVKIFLFLNEENLQFPNMVLTDEIGRDFGKHMNFLMSKVYKVFFQ